MVDPATPQHLKCNLHQNDEIATLTWDCEDNITSGVLLHLQPPPPIPQQQRPPPIPQQQMPPPIPPQQAPPIPQQQQPPSQ
eukprot:UN09454